MFAIQMITYGKYLIAAMSRQKSPDFSCRGSVTSTREKRSNRVRQDTGSNGSSLIRVADPVKPVLAHRGKTLSSVLVALVLL
jgi:hypothetical protein